MIRKGGIVIYGTCLMLVVLLLSLGIAAKAEQVVCDYNELEDKCDILGQISCIDNFHMVCEKSCISYNDGSKECECNAKCVCYDGQYYDCTTPDGCPGRQLCRNGELGECVKKDPTCRRTSRFYPWKIKEWIDKNGNGQIDEDEYILKIEYDYDEYGNVVKATDTLGRSQYTKYDSTGVLPVKGWNDEEGSEFRPAWEKTYHPDSFVITSVKDISGRVENYAYDEFWRIERIWIKGDSYESPTVWYERGYVNDPNDRFYGASYTLLRKKIEEDRYYEEKIYYDGFGRTIFDIILSGRRIVALDNILYPTGKIKRKYRAYYEDEGRGPYTEYIYYPDMRGKLKEVRSYDRNGNLLGTISYSQGIVNNDIVVTVTDEEGIQIRYHYDNQKRLIKVEEGRKVELP